MCGSTVNLCLVSVLGVAPLTLALCCVCELCGLRDVETEGVLPFNATSTGAHVLCMQPG